MTETQGLIPTIYEGWRGYNEVVTSAIRPLSSEQLALRAAPSLRSVSEIGAHIVGARARWFLQGGGDEFKALGTWGRPGDQARNAEELSTGLEATWQGMHDAIAGWTPEQWRETFPGEDESEPEVITRQWVIWHLIEHDLHHGGEISITLGAHGVPAIDL